jgi:large subunit ribosomal protein L29
MTKANDANHALREMTPEQLDEHLQQQRRKLFEVRMQQATGQVENFRQIREIRQEIARTMTVQVEAANAEAAQTAGATQ